MLECNSVHVQVHTYIYHVHVCRRKTHAAHTHKQTNKHTDITLTYNAHAAGYAFTFSHMLSSRTDFFVDMSGQISSRRWRQLSTKQWSGNKCNDVLTKIQSSNYAMDHRDWLQSWADFIYILFFKCILSFS